MRVSYINYTRLTSLLQNEANIRASHFPKLSIANEHLHLLDRCSSLSPDLPSRTTSSLPMVARTMGHSYQHWRLFLLASGLLLGILARVDASYDGDLQLVSCYVCWGRDSLHDRLCGEGKEAL